MSTEKQNDANRRNAQLSTGPRTPEGKSKSSLNALQHGLSSAQVLAPSESADDFNAHADSFRGHFAPADPLEEFLVDQLILAAWRLRRSRIIERFILEQQATDVQADLKKYKVHYTDPADYLALAYRKECDGNNALDHLSRHQTRIERAFYRALHELDRQRSDRPAPPAPQAPPVLQNEPNLRQVLHAMDPAVVGRLGPQAGTACPSPGSSSASPRSANGDLLVRPSTPADPQPVPQNKPNSPLAPNSDGPTQPPPTSQETPAEPLPK